MATKLEAGLGAQAEAALRSGDLPGARRLLIRSLAGNPRDLPVLLQLAGLERALGEAGAALGRVDEALALEPRDFAALLMRASLLDRPDCDIAAEAWAAALSQRPVGPLPPPMMAAIELGERRRADWTRQCEQRSVRALDRVRGRASGSEAWRIERFRTNILGSTRVYHSEPTQFHYPGLAEVEFYPRDTFPWLPALEAATDAIAAELASLLASGQSRLEPYVQYGKHLPLDQWRELNHSDDWSAIHLWKAGKRVDSNARHCPATMALLERIPQPCIPANGPNAMFSLLAPKTAIPPHVGVSNTRLVCHLPLIVPPGCWFRVGAETRHWSRGKALVFDDSIEHEARNESDQLRVVLVFDIWHPALGEVEREAVVDLMHAMTAGA